MTRRWAARATPKHEALRPAVRRAGRDHRDGGEGRGAGRVLHLRGAGRRRLGHPFPRGAAAEAAGLLAQACRVGGRSGGHSRLAVRGEPRRGRRSGGDHHAAAAGHRRVERPVAGPLGGAAVAPLARAGRRRPARGDAARLARAGPPRTAASGTSSSPAPSGSARPPAWWSGPSRSRAMSPRASSPTA